jgi:hypothetical protein
MAFLTTAAKNAAVKAILVPATTYYLALFTAAPGLADTAEVTGGSYARKAITFGTPSLGSEASTDAQTFTGMPAVSGDLWIGIFSVATAGTLIWSDPTAAVTGPIAAGATVHFAVGAVTAKVVT